MEARGAWCALEGRLTRGVVPMVYSFVCHAFSCELLLEARVRCLEDNLAALLPPAKRKKSSASD